MYYYDRCNYKKEQRWEMRYRLSDGTEKVCFPRSEEQKLKNYDYCKEHGLKVISCRKLYPFSTERNQHNFELIKNKCYNLMHDMRMGDAEYDEAEYERLMNLAEKASEYFGLELPVAWLPWEQLKEVKEISAMAVEFRVARCIEKGRYDLIQYC